MPLDIPRSVLLALWAGHLATDRDEHALSAAARAVIGHGEDHPDSDVRCTALLAQVAGTPVLAVLPTPGDPARLPSASQGAAMNAGQALLSGPPVGSPGLLRIAVPTEEPFGSELEPGELISWQVWTEPVDGSDWVPPVTDMSGARIDLAQALNLAIETLTSMDVARWREDAAEEIAMLASNTVPDQIADRLPPSLDGRRLDVLSRAVRLQAIIELATQDDGAAVNAWQSDQRTAALRHVDAAARNALVAISVSGF